MKNKPVTARSNALRLVTVSALALALAGSAAAEQFRVTLTNGTSFDTRYRPVEAEWDPEYSLIATDRGNWIALRNDEIVDVTSRAERTGFGYQLDTTTLFIGWSPNDIVTDDGESGPPAYGSFYGEDETSSSAIDQFVDVPGAGGTVGGFNPDYDAGFIPADDAALLGFTPPPPPPPVTDAGGGDGG